jgi:hypothetical protein
MRDIDWDLIDFEDFELLTYRLVEAMGFDEARRLSGPSDRGEDVVAFQPANIPGIRRHSRKWVFQCKKVKSIRKGDITDELANFAARRIDTWMLVTTFDPSPEFRRWFEGLSTSDRYGFHIQAWWKSDLESYVITYADHLLKYLPERISRQIGLDDGSPREDLVSVKAVLARFRLLADSQIERFARGKYIPKLYVQRRLQEEIVAFTASEAAVAKKAKTAALDLVEASINQLKDYIKIYNSKNAEIRKNIALHKSQSTELRERGESHKAETKKFLEKINSAKSRKGGVSLDQQERNEAAIALRKQEQEKLEQLYRSTIEQRQFLEKNLKLREANITVSKSFVDSIAANFRLCSNRAKELPDDHYLTAFDKYQILFDALAKVLALIDPNLKKSDIVSPPATGSTDSESYLKTAQAIQMLSDEGFIVDYKERIREGIVDIQRLFRNTLVIIDRAGSGKTNIICHLVNALSSDQATVLIFGKEPLQGSDGLVRAVTEVISKAMGDLVQDPVAELDRLLEKEGQFLTVFVDGINENRRITDLDNGIANFLEWSQNHRIRMVMTCRDIYWEFFSFDTWGHHVQKIIREGLNQFSPSEYVSALPLYLEFFHINCKLADEARKACHHPLLLRFFCEAYGSVEGPTITLGHVQDIRLKELFDVYLSRKADQIRKLLGHMNADQVSTYLFNLVSFMFRNLTTVISTTEVGDATGNPDTSTQQSLYLHLLDEDIIIEEQPGNDVHTRRVSFVYEEFMEYLLAKSIILQPKQFNITSVEDIFLMLDATLREWVNARGVGEYTALMLMDSSHSSTNDVAIRFLGMMARRGETWCDAFWSVIGKCPESYLGPSIFDEFYMAIDGLSNSRAIKKALSAMSRYSRDGSNKLASVLLWSVALPKALTWTDLNVLPEMKEKGLKDLGERLTAELVKGTRSSPPGRATFESLLNSILPFVSEEEQVEIEKALKNYGGPVDRVSSRALLRIFWKSFPEYYPLLLNGLFVEDEGTRSFCADRVRFTKTCAKQVSYLCRKLAQVETDSNVRGLLLDSARYLNHQT